MNLEVNLSKQETQALMHAAEYSGLTPDELAERQIRRYLGEIYEADRFSIAEENLKEDGTLRFVTVETEADAVLVLGYDLSEGRQDDESKKQAEDFIKSIPADGSAIPSPLGNGTMYRLSTFEERLAKREESLREDILAEAYADIFFHRWRKAERICKDKAEECGRISDVFSKYAGEPKDAEDRSDTE